MQERFKVNPAKVVHETIEGEAILIHLDNGYYYSLDGAGARRLGLLAESRSVDEVAAEVAGAVRGRPGHGRGRGAPARGGARRGGPARAADEAAAGRREQRDERRLAEAPPSRRRS